MARSFAEKKARRAARLAGVAERREFARARARKPVRIDFNPYDDVSPEGLTRTREANRRQNEDRCKECGRGGLLGPCVGTDAWSIECRVRWPARKGDEPGPDDEGRAEARARSHRLAASMVTASDDET